MVEVEVGTWVAVMERVEEVGAEVVTQEEVKTTVEEVMVVKRKEEEGQRMMVLVEGTKREGVVRPFILKLIVPYFDCC